MNKLKRLLSITIFVLLGYYSTDSFALPKEGIQAAFVARDPEVAATLGNNDMLYVLMSYESTLPLRFQLTALRDGTPLEVGAIRNPAVLHAPGKGEALVWVGYTNPTHIDGLGVTVFDEEWRELFRLTEKADVVWVGNADAEPRKAADWVDALIKTERRKMDFVFDASPQKNGLLYDIFFLLSIASIPAYLLLQLQMLRRYRYRWRELAVIPIFPYLILAFYAVAGLGIETSLQVTFLFRYTPLALLYLLILWLAKRFWQKKLPPPKLYKPPKA